MTDKSRKNRNMGYGKVLLIAFILANRLFSAEDTTGQNFGRLLGFELEKDSLKSIQEKFGPTRIYKDGDAAESSTRITYFVKEENCYVTFDAGEMGGGEFVDCFILRVKSNGEDSKYLSDLQFSKGDMGGLRIGMKITDFKNKIGKDYRVEDKRINKAFISKIAMTPSELESFRNKGMDAVEGYPFWDIVVNITGTFSDSTLTQLNICKTTTF